MNDTSCSDYNDGNGNGTTKMTDGTDDDQSGQITTDEGHADEATNRSMLAAIFSAHIELPTTENRWISWLILVMLSVVGLLGVICSTSTVCSNADGGSDVFDSSEDFVVRITPTLEPTWMPTRTN